MVNLKRGDTSEADEKTKTAIESQHEAAVESLRTRLETKVNIRTNAKGAGKIVINFKNQEDLNRIQELLG